MDNDGGKSEFGLIESWKSIDQGELDDCTPSQIFVLGYELADVKHQLNSGEAISRFISAKNRERVEGYCRKAQRQYRLVWASSDISEGYVQLDVAAGATVHLP